MDKHDIAKALDEVAKYLEITDANRFKSLAFSKAARAIEALDDDLAAIVADGRILSVPGVGKSIGPMIVELATTGALGYLEELRKQYPQGFFRLMKVPGLGLRKLGVLYETLGVADLDDLERACREGKLEALPGFGPKTQQTILEGVARVRTHTGQFLLPAAIAIAEQIAERIRDVRGVARVEIAGSVRRRLEVVQNVNLCVMADDVGKVVAAIRKRQLFDALQVVDGTTVRGMLRNDIAVDMRILPREQFGSALLRLTGSKQFVDALVRAGEKRDVGFDGFSLTKNGRPVATESEDAAFRTLGLPVIPAELRENADVLRRKKPVRLVETADLRGTFHAHTTYSDGRATLREMLEAAHGRGMEYFGISDHSKTAAYAGGLTVDRVREEQGEIDEERRRVPAMRVFKGTEADILADGSIDYDDATLASFDFVIASIHSRYKMTGEQITNRILRALTNPFVTFLGHLSGRLLLSRDPYELDLDRVFDTAAENGVMIEINGSPHRLDIDWRLMKRALDRGVRFSIHPDAHSVAEIGYVVNGTWAARKGGLGREAIFNTKPLDEVEEYLGKRRARAIAATR